MRRQISWLPDRIIITCATLSALPSSNLQNLKILQPNTKARIATHHLEIHSRASPSHSCHALKIYVSFIWRHLMTSGKGHVSLRHVINHTARHISSVTSSTPHQLADRWPEPTQIWPVSTDRWLWPGSIDFDFRWLWLLCWSLTKKLKFPKKPILLNFSRRFQFWTLLLHLKFRNWSIGIFFIVVSSKAFFKASLKDLLMLIQPQAFIELPPWVWGRVLEIY